MLMERIHDLLPAISGIRTRTIDLEEAFETMAARFARETGTVVLLSGSGLDCARYHLLALRPWLTVYGRHAATTVVIDEDSHPLPQPPLDVVESILARCRLTANDEAGPVAAGLFGYLAYDLKDNLERLPRTAVDDLLLPHLYLSAPSLIMLHDKETGATRLHAPVIQDGYAAADAAIDAVLTELAQPPPVPGGFGGDGILSANFSQAEYEAAVERIRDYIAAGDVYQVNLSQRFETGFYGDSYSLFCQLYRMNPAPFFAFVNAGDHQIVSTSPERFLMQSGRRVETRPIKGTRPRGKTPAADSRMQTELVSSPKDDAELSMIVDLLRNDIGRACAGGSVVVTQHKRLEAYRNVYHLVSVVEGTLAEDKGSIDLLQATFPGGSITGCPKIRSMEIIDALESRRRHVYTGSIGYISFHDTMDLSIAIRTATIVGRRLLFSVGGGIVYDSDPADEYAETLHKGETLLGVLQDAGDGSGIDTDPWVWHTGRLIRQADATVPITDLGLQYGAGCFETIRVDKCRISLLDDHLQRFDRTWAELFGGDPPDLTWKDIITRVIEKNDLAATTAAVKIMATRGPAAGSGFNGSLLVTARPYTHRLAGLGTDGLALKTYPHARLTPLADHKTFNYLFYHRAGLWAIQNGAHEALIRNPDATVSETHTANLLIVSGRIVTQPVSPHVLPGVMQAAVSRWFVEMGYTVVRRPLRTTDLFDAELVLLTNALMGPVPALALDDRPLGVDRSLSERLNRWFARVPPAAPEPV